MVGARPGPAIGIDRVRRPIGTVTIGAGPIGTVMIGTVMIGTVIIGAGGSPPGPGDSRWAPC
ncbi:hypothetical protein [Raineyella fluvialis]|uniref:hypothetical protein n=1 Tax=Raineyella fluvialis TaxID=2662261 RepID=UPI00188F1219|nr:hypothetical protein [Raineyella fluvialis]